MNITREHIDDLNAILKVSITREDYTEKVDTILNDYRKKAAIPGFRKGHVPMGLVKKQYGKAVLVDEVNKLLQDALHKYLTEEKLDVLGNPLPRMQDNFNWETQDFSFEFDLGLAPGFEVNLKFKKPITHYHIVADDKMINEHIASLRKQYGKLLSTDSVRGNSEIIGTFINAEKAIHNRTTLSLDQIKGKRNTEKFTGAKTGDTLTLSTKNLFKDDHDLMNALKVSHDDVHDLDIEVTFTIDEINEREPAALDQDFFDKLFGKDVVTSEKELKAQIKEESEKQFKQQADRQLLNDVTSHLIENTKFDLPAGFLKKWIRTTGENPLTEDEAEEAYEKFEKGLRYQLIESKIVQEHGLQIRMEELQAFAGDFVRLQMSRFGQTDPDDEAVANIVSRILANQDEAKRLSEQLMSNKLMELYKENANLKTKEISYENFVKEVYG
ncbi:MAG: trigger factor [Sinomicrobium sp.]|nr:trigger factor [Sinomicrobium sp.]